MPPLNSYFQLYTSAHGQMLMQEQICYLIYGGFHPKTTSEEMLSCGTTCNYIVVDSLIYEIKVDDSLCRRFMVLKVIMEMFVASVFQGKEM